MTWVEPNSPKVPPGGLYEMPGGLHKGRSVNQDFSDYTKRKGHLALCERFHKGTIRKVCDVCHKGRE